jgi:hypothetical protein
MNMASTTPALCSMAFICVTSQEDHVFIFYTWYKSTVYSVWVYQGLSYTSHTLLARPAGRVSSSIFLQKNKLLNSCLPSSTVIQSLSPTNTYSSAVIVKVVCEPLRKDPYVIMHTAATTSIGLQHIRLTLMQLPPTIATYLQYIPAHVGIEPSETIDSLAKHYASAFSPTNQFNANIDLSALKSTLKHSLLCQWINSTPLLGA